MQECSVWVVLVEAGADWDSSDSESEKSSSSKEIHSAKIYSVEVVVFLHLFLVHWYHKNNLIHPRERSGLYSTLSRMKHRWSSGF